jgi:hypothetical protein
MAVDPIISDLRYVMETSQELDILNFYKSFPVTCKAQVEAIENETVLLRVQPPGSVCLESQEHTIVLSRGLPEAVRARVVAFDLPRGALRLSDFSYVGAHFGERMIARVQPEDKVDVEIETDAGKVNGTLVDVSLSGVGVYVRDEPVQRGQMVHLTLNLPEGPVTLPGKVLNVTEAPEDLARLAVGFTRNAQEIAVVMRYIKDRRTEILSEIERMYDRAYRQRLAEPGKGE